MALNRINSADELFVGGVFGVNRGRLVQEHHITHILSVIKYSLNRDEDAFRDVEHLSIDIDDMDDQDILVHLPRMVRFINGGLHRDATSGRAISDDQAQTADTIAPSTASSRSSTPGAVLVHCAMGKSRSVTAVIAYLLWKHPQRFGKADPTTTAEQAVAQALQWVRETRPVAEPNDGFMRQLEMWWDMGCPADSDDAVEKEPAYQRWLYKREVEDAARIGRAPDWIRFEDEATKLEGGAKAGEADGGDAGTELRCKKCRRVLATGPFIVPHQGRGNAEQPGCPHFFIEALSWMRPILEEGALDGRLICPNSKCSASIGRYAWQGFKCSCGQWVAPAFSLQNSKVDKVVTGRQNGGAAAIADRMAALGIRMPPGAGRSPIVATSGAGVERCKENL
ncbi:protein-tyrosine phosphatase-like protein [Parachaetomium inaequale]|uniref:protein-tyrosine-phosphatase n=1 Tax=Parachaetomium inaequale TaxID=2588326 RepID=A0AAN6PDW2_9PEZI|nr:protein-tyrosine phosphatase-like protein [Parachaetomium inaequale]